MKVNAYSIAYYVLVLLIGGGCSQDSDVVAAGQGVEHPAGFLAEADATPARDFISAECPPISSGTGAGTARNVTVDAQQVVGRLRSLQGAHWNPGPANQALSQQYAAIGVDMIRTHDIGGILGGSGVGDIDGPGRDRLFPDMNADPNNPASYNFAPTDAALRNIRDAGAEIFFRVGRSNLGGSANAVPMDFDKYAEIVKHVVMHYNQGWANGFKLGIRYFEIWNEPDFLPFWTGTGAQYHELYKKIALAIKSVDGTLLVGGPANSTFNDKSGTRASLLNYIRDNKLPLDFYSFHKYTNKSQDPLDFARMARSFRKELDDYGFTNAQIMNTEFASSLQGDVILGGEAGRAAFLAESLMYMQDAPVDRAMSYARFGAQPTKSSLAFSAISKLKATPRRLCAQGGNDQGFAVLAGRSESAPELQVVVANYEISPSLMGPIPGGNEEEITIPGRGRLATMTYLDRRTITYPDKDGYALTVKSVPESWGDVTIKQYRIDASNDLRLVSTKVSTASERRGGSLTVSGAWARARANPPSTRGAAQGLDLVVVTGTSATRASQ